MTGTEARDYILSQIAKSDPEGKHTSMKLSIELATDLLKLSPREVGSFADKMFRNGLAALTEHGLYGYTIDIDRGQAGHVVEFGA